MDISIDEMIQLKKEFMQTDLTYFLKWVVCQNNATGSSQQIILSANKILKSKNELFCLQLQQVNRQIMQSYSGQ